MATTYQLSNDIIWPDDLEQPARPPALVYLDMLGFINLAEVAVGKTAAAGYDVLLPAALRARREGRVCFSCPLHTWSSSTTSPTCSDDGSV